MAIAEKRAEFKNKTNLPTKDFRDIKSNDPINNNNQEKKETDESALDGLMGESGLGGMADSISDAVGSVSDTVGSAIDNVSSAIETVTSTVTETVDAVMATVDKYSKIVNKAMNFGNAVVRFCKDPSFSSMTSLGSSIKDMGANFPGLEGTYLGDSLQVLGNTYEKFGAAGASIEAGVNKLYSAGKKAVGGLGSVKDLDSFNRWVSSSVGGIKNATSEFARSTGRAEKMFTSMFGTANLSNIPGTIQKTSSNTEDESLIEGMCKGAANVLGSPNRNNSICQYLEVSDSKLADKFNYYLPSYSSNMVESVSFKDTSSDNMYTASAVKQAMKEVDEESRKSEDNLSSTKTSNGSNVSWSYCEMLSGGSSKSPVTDQYGYVTNTSRELLDAISEKSKVNNTIGGYMATKSTSDVSGSNLNWNSLKDTRPAETSITSMYNCINYTPDKHDNVTNILGGIASMR